jgi:peroxiredoxin
MSRKGLMIWVGCICIAVLFTLSAVRAETSPPENIYPVGKLKPRNSETTLKVGDKAPDFTLPAVKGGSMSLGQFMGRKNVVLSFVPAAWTPVCTYQWPVYDMAKEIFDDNDAVLLGITVDNIPTLYAWTGAIAHSKEGFWFPVLSDFYPHGQVAKMYGVLRQEGFTERALFVIDKKGVIRFMDIHDINERPPLTQLQKALQSLN